MPAPPAASASSAAPAPSSAGASNLQRFTGAREYSVDTRSFIILICDFSWRRCCTGGHRWWTWLRSCWFGLIPKPGCCHWALLRHSTQPVCQHCQLCGWQSSRPQRRSVRSTRYAMQSGCIKRLGSGLVKSRQTLDFIPVEHSMHPLRQGSIIIGCIFCSNYYCVFLSSNTP